MKLWAALEEQGAPFITIPHVMGEWTEPDAHPLWVGVNNEHQPIGEIYSQHNLIAEDGFLRDDPQRFELGMEDTWSYQYAWHVGHRIGLIGSSDNHLGIPGANDFTTYVGGPGGLAVALAERNDRGAIWDAFEGRRTYATTGTRIFLDFRIDGHVMGDEFASTTNPTIAVAVAGTAALERVELVKHDGSGYEVICADEPNSEISSFDYVDADFRESSFYYVRVAQVDVMPLTGSDLPMTGNCAVPRRVINETDMFDERIGFSYARTSSIMIGGEDSLLSLRVKQAGYSIYYQPQARAWHKIPKNKLTRRYFLRRNFWEGARATLIQALLKSAIPYSLTTNLPRHINEISRQAWRSFLDGDQSRPNILRAKAWMGLAALCSYNLGVVYCRLRLLRGRQAQDS
jgi:hypothetical protein